MYRIALTLFLLLPCLLQAQDKFALVIHGGAGTILKENMTDEMEAAYEASLRRALDTGYAILERGGSSLDAVEQTIRIMEDDSLFNSGRGAVFTNAGTNELDASIMDGKNLNAGAVAGVKTVRHPISAARAVMDSSVHVMMSGDGADQFAKSQGLEIVDPSWFKTERRWKQIEKRLNKEEGNGSVDYLDPDYKYGTVGCVALDNEGNIAAGTSTGGMTNKKWGRIGDSPVIGAGTYANNKTCGVSCTGHGEYFIRYAVAHGVSMLMEHGGMELQNAAHHYIHEVLKNAGGSGGLIALDSNGKVVMRFNTAGMYRGYRVSGEEAVIAIYGE